MGPKYGLERRAQQFYAIYDKNQGIKVNSEGVFQLIKFNALPGSAPEGGLAISANNFYVGL